MATVKILYDDQAAPLEKYLKEGKESKMLTTEHLCELDGAAKEFAALQRDTDLPH